MPVDIPYRFVRWRERQRTLFLALISLSVFVPIAVLLWFTLIGVTSPIYSDTLISVEPADRVLNRDTGTRLVVKRELCSRRAARAVFSRQWLELEPDGETAPQVVYSTFTRDMIKGCRTTALEQPIPRNLAPGLYSYEVSIRICSMLAQQCPSFALSPIPVAIVGGPWPKVVVPPPPPLVMPAPREAGE